MTSLVFNDPAKSAQGDKTDGNPDHRPTIREESIKENFRGERSEETRGSDGVGGFHNRHCCLEMWSRTEQL